MLERNSSYRLVIYLVGFASIFVILSGIRALSSVLNPILLALVITITVLPLPGKLNARGVPGWLSFVLTILLVVGLLGLVILTVFFSVSRLSIQLPTYLTEGADQFSQQIQQSFDDPAFLLDETSSLSITLRSPLVQNVLGIAAGIVVQFGLTLFIFFFMLSAAINLPDAARLGLDPQNSTFSRVQGLTEDVRQYVTILTGINFLVGLGNTILLYILGVDYALLWGILSWFMGYIPSVGFLIALVPPLLLAYVEQGPTTALIVLVGYIVINGGIQNFVQPKIMGDGLKLSPVVIFISLFVWAFLLGGIGAILAVPLTLLVVAIMEEFDGTRNAAALMRYTGRKTDENATNLLKNATRELNGIWTQFRQPFKPDSEE
jgi:predicted PurR-regulated permease PerM